MRDGWTLIAGAVAGTPVGLWLEERLEPALLMRLLGVVLILFSVNELLLAKRGRFPVPKWLGLPIGVVCGILGAAFNIGGPPAIVYVYACWPLAAQQAIATIPCKRCFLFNIGSATCS